MPGVDKIPTYAYFYPITMGCEEKQLRAQEHGTRVVDEIALAASALALFEGHDQPKRYCLGDASIRSWDDADPAAMQEQVGLARYCGIDGFIFDTYIGERRGRRTQEAAQPVNNAFLGASAVQQDMQFAVSAVLEGPHAVLPVPRDRQHWERGRPFDYSRGTAEAIVDTSATKYWERDNYIRMPGDRPYMSLWFSRFFLPEPSQYDTLNALQIAEHIKAYSEQRYGIVPYIAGICLSASNAYRMRGSSFDALTGYAFLPDFEPGAEPMQDYKNSCRKKSSRMAAGGRRSGDAICSAVC